MRSGRGKELQNNLNKKRERKKENTLHIHADLSLLFTRTDVCATRAPGLVLASPTSINRPVLVAKQVQRVLPLSLPPLFVIGEPAVDHGRFAAP